MFVRQEFDGNSKHSVGRPLLVSTVYTNTYSPYAVQRPFSHKSALVDCRNDPGERLVHFFCSRMSFLAPSRENTQLTSSFLHSLGGFRSKERRSLYAAYIGYIPLLHTHIFVSASQSIGYIYTDASTQLGHIRWNRYYYLRRGGYIFVVVCLSVVCLSVCLLATLRKIFRTDLHENFREGWQMIKFWWRSGSPSGCGDFFPDSSLLRDAESG